MSSSASKADACRIDSDSSDNSSIASILLESTPTSSNQTATQQIATNLGDRAWIQAERKKPRFWEGISGEDLPVEGRRFRSLKSLKKNQREKVRKRLGNRCNRTERKILKSNVSLRQFFTADGTSNCQRSISNSIPNSFRSSQSNDKQITAIFGKSSLVDQIINLIIILF